jgi:radical SAM protein with 4Fe4S-binding SPASM domain
MNSDKKIILYGAGKYGAQALSQYGGEKVLCFADRDPLKAGTVYLGKDVICFDEMILRAKTGDVTIVLALLNYAAVKEELAGLGVKHTEVFKKGRVTSGYFFPSNVLLVDNWDGNDFADLTENEYAARFADISETVDNAVKNAPLFEFAEIETFNKCNGLCAFCPVNARDDTRIHTLMPDELFYDIIGQLKSLNYSGFLSLFSNNEPFLDSRLTEFTKHARESLPNAYLHLWTNGSLLTAEKYEAVIGYLNELVINNYNDAKELNGPVKKVFDYIGDNKELTAKTTIVLRKQNQVLSTRGGTAPNKKIYRDFGGETCYFPFRQMVIRPTGKVSLCCNDPLGKYTLGDLTEQSVTDVWYGEKFREIRELISKGRKNVAACAHCDVIFTL